jgi:pilus assembly protein Flp/PilA
MTWSTSHSTCQDVAVESHGIALSQVLLSNVYDMRLMLMRLVLNAYWKARGATHLHRQSGQGLVEYALILVLVSIVVVVMLLTMGKQIRNVYSNVAAALG